MVRQCGLGAELHVRFQWLMARNFAICVVNIRINFLYSHLIKGQWTFDKHQKYFLKKIVT